MTELIFDKWLIEYDKNATQKAYEEISVGGAEECSCGYCENFVKARAQFFSSESLHLLAQLGIDHTKDVETYSLGDAESGLELYGVWYYFIGKVEERFAAQVKGDNRFSIEFAPATGEMAAQSFANQPLGIVAIENEIAWLLEESNE